MPCFFIWVEVWLRLAPCSLPWRGGGLAVRVLPLWAQEHSRRTNKAIAVLLLQCWVDKSFSAGLLPLKRRSCASPLVNDLTHFFFLLQSFHKSLLLGYHCYSPSPFPPSWFLNPPPTFYHPLFHPYCKQMEEKVSISNMFFPLLKHPSTLQNQHGINKFNMNWKLMKCSPPPLLPDCQSLGGRLSSLKSGKERERRENELIVTIAPSKAAVCKTIKVARCQEADLGDWLQHARHSSVTWCFVISFT